MLIGGGILARTLAVALSAVEHFDEGVYASNLFFGPPDYAYPLQALYAPPLVPAMIEAGMLLGLPPNVAALVPAFLAGSLTLWLLWWCGRRWLGPDAALASLALAACSDLHVLLSSAALTDGCLWLWVLLAVAAAWQALLSGDLRWAVAGGLASGLAWWTKYNGWLPLAIVGAAAPLAWWVGSGGRALLVRWLKVAAVMAVVAILVSLPWLVSLQAIGGYRAVAANHARYVVGLAGWPESAWRHLAQQGQLQSWLGPLGMGLAVLLASPTRRDLRAWGLARHLVLAAATGLAAWWLGVFPLLAVASLAGLARSGWRLYRLSRALSPPTTPSAAEGRPSAADGAPTHQSQVVAWSLVAAWWLGLFVATPCYTPYARLALGWVVASWLAAGLLALDPPWAQDQAHAYPPSEVTAPSAVSRRAGWSMGTVLVTLVLGLGVITGLQVGYPKAFMPIYLPRQAVRDAARQIVQELPQPPIRVVYVYGDPALFFQLRVAGEALATPVAHVPDQPAEAQGQPVPTYLVVSSYALRDPQFARSWSEQARHWQPVFQRTWRPSPLVWLDWEAPRRPRPVVEASLQVYRLRD
jgi:4-amino-4-deoxy-L-arabinose transferase-like glycosyltransferase